MKVPYKTVILFLLFFGTLLLCSLSSKVNAKERMNLYTQEEILMAREKVKKEPWARQLYDEIIRQADKWVSYSDEYLRYLIAPASVPRAFDVNFKQCPIHSEEIKKYGSYPWIIDLDNPWKVKCPVGGEYYPTNDFDPLNSGNPEDVTEEEFIDDGWGWKKPGESQKYWFVAYYNHWSLYKHIIPATELLGKAYLLTENTKYSRKAAVILDRIAEVYPDMDHVNQSRYGTEIQVGTYHGRIINSMWETEIVTTMAMAYDFIYEGLEGDSELEESLGKCISSIKENIETNLLENAAQSIYAMDGRIRGGYSRHQSALATIAVVLDNENSDNYIDWVLFNSGEDSSYIFQGIASGLYNLLYHDGAASNSAPGYNCLWISMFTNVAEVLLRRGIDLYEEYPKLKMVFDIPIAWVMNGEFTPNIGDAGSVLSKGRVGWTAHEYEIAFRRYGDPNYAKVLNHIGAYEKDLFTPSIKDEVDRAIKLHGRDVEYTSQVLSGYGLAMLRGGPKEDPLSVSFYYGKGGGHDHFARLNIEVFGKGARLVPDLGYPEFMSGYHKKLCGWTGHTVSHATVMVNQMRQLNKEGGRLHSFVSAEDVQYADASAEAAYKGIVEGYRRSLLLLDAPDEKNAYILDIFRVKGGFAHDYSIHGPTGVFSVEGLNLSKVQREGTLAGEGISFGTLHDAPHLEKSQGPYSSYLGSGFGYLYNVQRAKPQGTWSANWDLKDGKKTGLKMTFLGDEEVVVAEGDPPQKGNMPKSLKYILRQRKGERDLESTYITIIQPYTGRPFIKDARFLGQDDTGVAIAIDYSNKTDYIIQDIGEGLRKFQDGLSSQAGVARVIVDNKGEMVGVSLIAGNLVEKDGFKLEIEKGYMGQVEAIDYKGRRVVVRLCEESAPLPIGGALEGRSLIFANEYRSTEYKIGEVEFLEDGRYSIELIGNDFICGYGRCQRIRTFSNKVSIIVADRDLYKREYYEGMYLAKVGSEEGGLITRAESDGISFVLSSDKDIVLEEGDAFYIYDFGVGSRFTIDTVASLNIDSSSKKRNLLSFTKSTPEEVWSLETTSSIILTLAEARRVEYMNLQDEWVEVEAIPQGSAYAYHISIEAIPSGRGTLRVTKIR